MDTIFIVQGEGRGHMTQALAMQSLLRASGHKVLAVCIGTSQRREIPSFFVEKIDAPMTRFRSPNFVTDKDNKGVLIGASIWQNLLQTDTYLKSLKTLDEVVSSHRPDLVVNFYEPLWGLYQQQNSDGVRSVCVAHQFLAGHQDFPFPAGRSTERTMLKTLNSITAAGSIRRLCLSFTPMEKPDDARLSIVPPLLRSRLFDLDPVEDDFLLVYVMQAGYADEIKDWHERNPSVAMHCFWDRKGAPETEEHDKNLTFHQLSDSKFLDMMSRCRGLVTTAGFESVCEAMYLGKPVFMVPVAGHYEQACNAQDATRAGAGIWSDTFDLGAFIDYLPHHGTDHDAFRRWVDSAAEKIILELERSVD